MKKFILTLVSIATLYAEKPLETDLAKHFTAIYKNNIWGKSRLSRFHGSSGNGSTIAANREIIHTLISFIEEHKIKTFLDIGCGECEWIHLIPFEELGTQYIGCDVVSFLIDENKERFISRSKMSFTLLDSTYLNFPKCDVMFIKDVLMHWSADQCAAFIKGAKETCHYLIIIEPYWSRLQIKKGDDTTLAQGKPRFYFQDKSFQTVKDFFYREGLAPDFTYWKRMIIYVNPHYEQTQF